MCCNVVKLVKYNSTRQVKKNKALRLQQWVPVIVLHRFKITEMEIMVFQKAILDYSNSTPSNNRNLKCKVEKNTVFVKQYLYIF